MWTRDAAQTKATIPLLASGGPVAPAPAKPSGKPFAQLLQQAQGPVPPAHPPAMAAAPAVASHTIGHGDTLIGVVRQQAQQRSVQLSSMQELRLAQQLASANGISNPDLVYPGQAVGLSSLQADLRSLQAGAAPRTAPVAHEPHSQPPRPLAAAAAMATPGVGAVLSQARVAHPVLEKTLDRAVAKGFIPASDKASVYSKILQMAENHRFAPDDFARMTLMESDGMNPRASNQRCHGIIQFCDGPARGAASAGYASNPRAILDLSVSQQLNLVDKYFDDVGLKSQGPAGLEDLYLSVLNPASRAQGQKDAPLNIQGQQARALHVGNDGAAPITRQSIRQGLLENAAARLGQMLPAGLRVQAQRVQQYVENTLP